MTHLELVTAPLLYQLHWAWLLVETWYAPPLPVLLQVAAAHFNQLAP